MRGMRGTGFLVLAVFVALAAACARGEGSRAEPATVTKEAAVAWPKVWLEQVGKTVTVEGTPANALLGPLLVGEDDGVWIDGLDEWPAEVFGPDHKGKRIRVTGTVIIREDLPAYVQKPGELPRTGIPVQDESQLKAASTRVLLKDASWSVIE